MKYALLFLGLAAFCAAQAAPVSAVIVKTISLENQTSLAGSQQAPVTIETPTEDGLYRMSMYIFSDNAAVSLCHPNPPNSLQEYPYGQCAQTYDGASVVIFFPAKAGQAIGYYTLGTLNSGQSYNMNIVLERF